jgi:hypothetical protein
MPTFGPRARFSTNGATLFGALKDRVETVCSFGLEITEDVCVKVRCDRLWRDHESKIFLPWCVSLGGGPYGPCTSNANPTRTRDRSRNADATACAAADTGLSLMVKV